MPEKAISRPTIALCMIIKNEAHNLTPLLQSVKGCFDEIHITDTGSTDNSIEFIQSINKHIAEGDSDMWQGYPEIHIHHFDWINDFSAARNYSFSHAKSDYICWLDADDAMSDPKAFIHWRDTTMHSAHYWVALYNYAFGSNGAVECKFIRERVVKNNYGFSWHYFVHEGLLNDIPGKKFWPQRVSSWCINHRRTAEDQKQDTGRNIALMEKHDVEKLPPRMKFYYGKELVENGKPKEGGKPLMEAITSGQLDIHDKILAFQYAAQSANLCKAYEACADITMNGLRLYTTRAELWCLLGDAYLGMNRIQDAKLSFQIASICEPNDYGGTAVIYGHAYEEYPRMQLAQIAMNTGNMAEAEINIKIMENDKNPKAPEFRARFEGLKDLNTVREDLPKVDDVIITCPPGGVVTDWDENTLEAKGHGGSETAAIEVAKWIKKKTNRRVKIFHQRAKRDVMASGVEYLPVSELVGYLHNVEPHAHIAWRHAVPLSKAKSYVWCHDLQCPGAEKSENYTKIMALSGFHKHYLMETNGVPEDKIVLGFNGINPDDFKVEGEKNPLKVIFSSSPDRGLVQAIDIVKKAREITGLEIELHCFYGTSNMRAMGASDWADQIEKKIKENEFVKFHGMVTKKVLMKHFKEAAVWLYPADFIETYCLTVLEASYSGCWSIVRPMGALPFTMKEVIDNNMCDMVDVEVTDEASIGIWANVLAEAILDKKYLRVNLPITRTWESVADKFISELAL